MATMKSLLSLLLLSLGCSHLNAYGMYRLLLSALDARWEAVGCVSATAHPRGLGFAVSPSERVEGTTASVA
jgi:hypothetical protein